MFPNIYQIELPVPYGIGPELEEEKLQCVENDHTFGRSDIRPQVSCFFSVSRMDGGIDTAYSAIWLLPQEQFVSYHFDLWYISIADAKMKPNRPL